MSEKTATYSIIYAVVAVLFMTIFLSGNLFAADSNAAGAVELKLLTGLIQGQLGLFVGLIIAAMGLWMIIKGSMVPGITFLVVAVVVTSLPTVYNGITLITCPIAKSLGSNVTCEETPL
jgi:hypothetical protein